MWPKNSVIVFTLTLPYAGNLFIADTLSFRYVSNILFVDETMIWKVLTIQQNENSRLKVNGEVIYENSNRKIETSRKKRWGLHEFFSCASFCKIFFLLLFLCRKICFVVPFPHPLKKLKDPFQMNASHQPRLLKETRRLAKLVINVYFKWYENNKQQISEIWSPD